MPERLGVQVVNINVDLMYVYTCSFLHSEADLMGNAVYGSSDVGTVGHFDMQVDDKTAVLVGAQTNALVFSESLACGKSRNSGTESADVADVCDTEAVRNSVFNEFGEIIFRNSDLSDMIFKAYHESSLLFEKMRHE